MICHEIRRIAYFYLDGTVGSGKSVTVETHLKQCPECGVRVKIHERARQVLKVRLVKLEAPPSLRERIRQACRG